VDGGFDDYLQPGDCCDGCIAILGATDMRESSDGRAEDLISLAEVWHKVRPVRWSLAAGALIGALAAWALTGLIQPVYRAQVTVLPAKQTDTGGGLNGIAGQVGGLAALAGLNIGGNDSQAGSLEYLKSSALAQKFIETHGLMPVLGVPTMAGAVRKFHKDTLRVSEDKQSGLITISANSVDPAKARAWANEFVSMANQGLRNRAIAEAQATLDYLNPEIEKTSTIQTRDSLYRIVESQLKTIAVAKGREEYAFRVIDSALLPDDDDIVRPNKAIYTAAGFILGGLLGAWFWSKLTHRTRG
jgi:uncharacterized protein involved in exopolysaccharide biosynthesis